MELSSDQMVSIGLVTGMMLISGLRGMLNRSGLVAAATVGFSVSLLGHWT